MLFRFITRTYFNNVKENVMLTKKRIVKASFAVSTLLAAASVAAHEIAIPLNLVTAEGKSESVGMVKVTASPYGTLFTPDLQGLPPGLHGFHVHQNPSCAPAEKAGKMVAAEAAGGHYDPKETGLHAGPYGNGHLGDLPALYVDQDGKSSNPVLAPRIKLADIEGRALMIHAGGDNHSDQPEKLGGGGARMACGVVTKH